MSETPQAHERQLRADRLKERLYITFALLAVVLATLGGDDPDDAVALVTIIVTAVATVLAVFVADVVSHLVVHEALPEGHEFRRILMAVSGGLSAAVVPVVLLTVALITHMTAETALTAAAYALVVTLVVIGWTAIRRVPLTWWQRLIALGAEAVIGLVVVGLQVLAKSH
jgi:hypothetical protein